MKEELNKRVSTLINIVLLLMALYNLYTLTWGVYDIFEHMCINLVFVLPLLYILYPPRARKIKKIYWFDCLLAIYAFTVTFMLYINYWDWIFGRNWLASPLTPQQLFVGISLILLIVEAVRRSLGKMFTLVLLIFLAYIFLAPYLPYPLGFRTSFTRTIEFLTLTPYGLFSVPLQVMTTYVIAFTILGAVFSVSGVSDFFIEFSKALVGKMIGGAAKIAVVASSLFGTISGVAVANVYGTGVFTIPTMKKLGYPSRFAAAVEAVASTGGQIMPPIMGASAFIIAELLGLPYARIMIAAVIPALLYYLGVYVQVHYFSLKHGLVGLPKEAIPSLSELMKRKGYNLIPLVVLIYALLGLGWNPISSAMLSLYTAIALSFIRKDVRKNPQKLVHALIKGARDALTIITVAAGAGLIVGVIGYSGLGVKAGSLVKMLSFGLLPIGLLYVAFISILLGMGMPTTAAYIMASALSVPALQQLGNIDLLQAHFFVFYYAVFSAITPPVALAAYAAASLAKTDPMKVGWQAIRLGYVALIVPFIFIYKPALLLIESGSLLTSIWQIITAFIAVYAVSLGLEGFMKKPMHWAVRILLIVSGLALLAPTGSFIDIFGLMAIALTLLFHLKYKRTSQSAT